MSKLPSLSISDCERGNIAHDATKKLISEPQQNGVHRLQLIWGAMCIFLFNLCLLCIGYICFKYVNSFQEKQRNEITDGFCSLVGVVIIILLIHYGDLSKNNPNFYYI